MDVRRFSSPAAALLALLLLPAGAAAQDAPRTDPEVGSPSEAVYGIPLEEARRDAAPNLVPDSAIRTENGVGSSAEVPGHRAEDPRGGPPSEPRRARVRRRERREAIAEAGSRIAGRPSPVGTAAVLVLVVALAGAGAALTGRLVGPRARL